MFPLVLVPCIFDGALTVSRFTARGIIALVFSCISGVLGLVIIAWYGAVEIKP